VTLREVIRTAIPVLERAGVPYMVTGSIASTWYGEPRASLDLDIVIDPPREGIERLLELLEAAGFHVDRDAAQVALRDRTEFSAIGADASRIDFIVRKDRPFSRREFARRRSVDLLGSTAWMVSVEDLIVAKLEWSQATDTERHLRDLRGIVAIAGDDLDREYVTEWIDRLGLRDATIGV
jgi:hypothetical protein